MDGLKVGEIKTRKWTIAACSAKTMEGIEEGMTWLI
jgi:ADP-ribosylation factor-like protein 3